MAAICILTSTVPPLNYEAFSKSKDWKSEDYYATLDNLLDVRTSMPQCLTYRRALVPCYGWLPSRTMMHRSCMYGQKHGKELFKCLSLKKEISWCSIDRNWDQIKGWFAKTMMVRIILPSSKAHMLLLSCTSFVPSCFLISEIFLCFINLYVGLWRCGNTACIEFGSRFCYFSKPWAAQPSKQIESDVKLPASV